MDTKQTSLDDLTIIKGIGRTRQEWLRNAFNVRTYNDLATLSPAQIEAQLKAERQIASRSEIAAWICKAQELSIAVSLNQTGDTSSITSSHENRSVLVSDPLPVTEWQASARFVVEFQTSGDEVMHAREQLYRTVANHLDLVTDRPLGSESWSGLQSERLCAWMLEQVDKPVEPPVPIERRSAVKAAPTVNVKIREARLFQPPDGQSPIAFCVATTPFQGVINSGEPFALDVLFDVSGLTAADVVDKQTFYRTQCYLLNLTTGAASHLADSASTSLDTGQFSYRSHLYCTALLPGLYHLRILLSLESKPPLIDYMEASLLQVI